MRERQASRCEGAASVSPRGGVVIGVVSERCLRQEGGR
jgi:hypothetical protein